MGVPSFTPPSSSQGWLYLFSFLLCGGLLGGNSLWTGPVTVAAAPLLSSSSSQPERRQSEPGYCGEVAAQVAATRSANPGGEILNLSTWVGESIPIVSQDRQLTNSPTDNAAIPTVTAQLAFDCLQSVPNKREPARELIRSLQAYIEWQSTLAWLRDPPSTYSFPAADIPKGLAEIGNAAANGSFTSEYDFQLSILKVFASAHDGHFSFRGDVFKPFGFGNALAADIVAVSRDGKEPPRLYHGRWFFLFFFSPETPNDTKTVS